MRRAPRCRRLAVGVVIAGAGLIGAQVPAPPGVGVRAHAVRLAGADLADFPLALIMGGTGTPLPPQQYLQAADTLYLQPLGFHGTPQALFTPAGLYPATGVKSLTVDASEAQGQQILDDAIRGQTDGAGPVVVFGWSQSAALSSLAMPELHEQGIDRDDLHFVLVGDTSNPNGGLLERFDIPTGSDPSVPSLGITFGGATPDDLYPTDIYTLEYDGFADFPQYPLNFLSVANALAGITFEHLTYLNLTSEQIASAIPLQTAGDSLAHYFMIPTENLPLLEPLRLLPVIGNPLADLLQPDLRVLVNLGYGSITEGWSQGPANVPTPLGLFPADLDWADVLTALAKGVPQGIQAAIRDLLDPDNYRIPPILENPVVTPLVDAAYTTGLTDDPHPSLLELARDALSGFAHYPISDATLHSSPVEIVNALTATLSADYAALLPVADTLTALAQTLPAYNVSIFLDQLQAGDLVAAIGLPIAADLALAQFAVSFGISAPLGEAALGTLLNLANLFA